MSEKILVLGATVAAAAIASVFKENCTVINKGYNCAYEYADAYKVHKLDLSRNYLPETENFIADLKIRNLLSDTLLHPLYLAGVMAEYFKKYGSSVYLGSTVEKITESDDGITAVFYINGEQITQTADILIDTTDFGKYKKVLFAALNAESDFDEIPLSCIIKGKFASEYYLKTEVTENESFRDAVLRINDIWCKEISEKLPGMRFASVANDFATYYEKPVFERTSGRIIHMPSASFADVAQSFEGGLKCCSLI